MDTTQKGEFRYGGISPFELQIRYTETTRDTVTEGRDSHVHPECEVYINLSGDVSFMVEKRIYPITPGSIVITRPYEYHHCIYHSDVLHRHFWILFSPMGNERFLRRFFEREAGEGNLLTLPSKLQGELTELCHDMVNRPTGEMEEHYRFFRLLHLLETANSSEFRSDAYPEDVTMTLDYINRTFRDSISINALAKAAHVSVNTLERHFADTLHLSPTAYLKKKRLAHAASVLWAGGTVMEACADSGFSDYSGFIALFKRAYGMTPLKYKKHVMKKREKQ